MDFIEKINMLDDLLTMPLKNLKNAALTVFNEEEEISQREYEAIMFAAMVMSCIDIFETMIKSRLWLQKKSVNSDAEYQNIKLIIRNMANCLPKQITDVTDALVDTYKTGTDQLGISNAIKAKELSPAHGDLFDEVIKKLKSFKNDFS